MLQRCEGVGVMGEAIAGVVLFLSLKREGVHASRVRVYTDVIDLATASMTWKGLAPYESIISLY